MNTEHNFKIGQIVWYMGYQWAHVGKIQRKRVITNADSEQTDYELNGNWIPDCWVFATKKELKDCLIHHIDYNSPQE